jgi:hypothetical protein
MITALALAVIGRAQVGFPVGSYRVDVSKAPVATRADLESFFSRIFLRIQSDGMFYFCGMPVEGYWRKSGDGYPCVIDGLLSIPSKEPAAELQKKWPMLNAPGMILKRGPKGTLIMKDFIWYQGPVVFRPLPQRSIDQLLIASDMVTVKGTMATIEEAYHALEDRLETDWPPILSAINDPKRDQERRAWAASMLSNLKNPKAIEAAAQLILDLKPTPGTNRARGIRIMLSKVVSDHPTAKSVDLLIEAQRRGLIRLDFVATSIGNLGRTSDLPVLISWLGAQRKGDLRSVLEALAQFGAPEGLDRARALKTDPDDRLKIAAFGLIARVSPDPVERKSALAKLAGWLQGDYYRGADEAVKAIARSKSPDALPYLAAALLSNAPPSVRIEAAKALGDLGDPRAVPALIEAKAREVVAKSEIDVIDEAKARRAAAEALLKLSQSKGSG